MSPTSSIRSRLLAAALVLAFAAAAAAEPISSPTWGFAVDLPEGFQLAGGDRRNRFSFHDAASGASVDMVAYDAGRYASPKALLEDAGKRLLAKAEPSDFDYRGRKAAISTLSFTAPFGPAQGWALAVELGQDETAAKPLLLMIAYGKAGAKGVEARCLSALDSLAPRFQDRSAPGPVSVFAYPPRGKREVEIAVGAAKTTALIDESDAEAAKALVDREFGILQGYAKERNWKEAWARFYRAIWRDSYQRLANVAFAVERAVSASESGEATPRAIAEGALSWVQGFAYERDLMGSDFVDLVSAAEERRGDCDSRALLWAIIVQHSNMDAILMVSREYAHAMAAVKTAGDGARFSFGGADWIVAETTAKVKLGMIGKNVSDPAKWLGIDFPYLPAASGDGR